jgi:hypothetical protein
MKKASRTAVARQAVTTAPRLEAAAANVEVTPPVCIAAGPESSEMGQKHDIRKRVDLRVGALVMLVSQLAVYWTFQIKNLLVSHA